MDDDTMDFPAVAKRHRDIHTRYPLAPVSIGQEINCVINGSCFFGRGNVSEWFYQ